MGYEAFVLTARARAALKEVFPPTYPDFIGDHITHAFGVPRKDEANYNVAESHWEVVGRVDDSNGVEALVVRPVGSSASRPDGKPYHVTWSLDRAKGRKPVESNAAIAKGGVQAPPSHVKFTAIFKYVD